MRSSRSNTHAKPEVRVVLEVWEVGGAIQISIGHEDANGSGGGYRIAGPSFVGNSRSLCRKVLNERDAREIASYLEPFRPGGSPRFRLLGGTDG